MSALPFVLGTDFLAVGFVRAMMVSCLCNCGSNSVKGIKL